MACAAHRLHRPDAAARIVKILEDRVC
jgi:hypothetical protein